LEALNVDLNEGPHFMITGPVQSGKTTLLQSWVLALAERYTPQRLYLYLVDMRRSGLAPLRRLPHMKAYIDDDDKLSAALAEIRDLLRERRKAMEDARQEAAGTLDQASFIARYPAIVVAIDDYDAFRDTAQAGSKEKLEQLTRRERGLGFHVLMAGSTGDFSSSFEGLVKALKELQTGFVMGSNEQNDVQILNVRLPFGEAGKSLPAGQGYYTRRGRVRKIKASTCQAGLVQVRDWVSLISERRS
jgi:S-DNA-T family DNA segregation ATPase FtsK/SpoIIIE